MHTLASPLHEARWVRPTEDRKDDAVYVHTMVIGTDEIKNLTVEQRACSILYYSLGHTLPRVARKREAATLINVRLLCNNIVPRCDNSVLAYCTTLHNICRSQVSRTAPSNVAHARSCLSAYMRWLSRSST